MKVLWGSLLKVLIKRLILIDYSNRRSPFACCPEALDITLSHRSSPPLRPMNRMDWWWYGRRVVASVSPMPGTWTVCGIINHRVIKLTNSPFTLFNSIHQQSFSCATIQWTRERASGALINNVQLTRCDIVGGTRVNPSSQGALIAVLRNCQSN